MSSMLKPEGPILGQKYRLIAQLDQGGMGSVWVAEAVHLSSVVAVKIMDRELAATPEAAQRFLREARTAASLRSPHVVQILDYGVHDSTPFIAMELLEGESLAARLAREGRLASWQQTELVLRHVARALGRAHDAGVIHRDLKPANIFLVRDEEEEIVKLLDFGIAKTTVPRLGAAPDSNTRTGEFLGSPAYASPEQLQGSKTLDHRADIWSLGVIAYECLLGRPPFVSDSFVGLLIAICMGPLPVPSEQGSVPAGFDAWFARVCARDVELRFQSVREASAELRRLFAAAFGSGPAPSDGNTGRPPAAERALPAPESAPAVQTPPSGADPLRANPTVPVVSSASKLAAGTPPAGTLPAGMLLAGTLPAGKLAVFRTNTIRLVASQMRLGPRRRVLALFAALALPAIVALVFFTLDASTSRAALDWQRLALDVGPPSEPTRDEPPARGDEPPRIDPGGDAPAPRVAVVPSPDPLGAVPDASAAPAPAAPPALGSVAPDRVSPASDPATSPPTRARSTSPRTSRPRSSAPSSTARLTITASTPSEVLLDGVPLGTAPLEGVSVTPGLHEVTFIQNGKRTTQTLTIGSGEHKRVEARISPPLGDGLDEATVKRTIKRYRSAVVDTCWEHAFGSRQPGDPTSVRVSVTITVEPSGLVQSVDTAAEPSGYPELRRCIERRVSAWRFPGARAETVVSSGFVFVLE
jgi:serine/threonine protein kinase